MQYMLSFRDERADSFAVGSTNDSVRSGTWFSSSVGSDPPTPRHVQVSATWFQYLPRKQHQTEIQKDSFGNSQFFSQNCKIENPFNFISVRALVVLVP